MGGHAIGRGHDVIRLTGNGLQAGQGFSKMSIARRKYACDWCYCDRLLTFGYHTYHTLPYTIISTVPTTILLLLMYQKVASLFLGCSLLDSNGEWITFFALDNFDYYHYSLAISNER